MPAGSFTTSERCHLVMPAGSFTRPRYLSVFAGSFTTVRASPPRDILQVHSPDRDTRRYSQVHSPHQACPGVRPPHFRRPQVRCVTQPSASGILLIQVITHSSQVCHPVHDHTCSLLTILDRNPMTTPRDSLPRAVRQERGSSSYVTSEVQGGGPQN